jgi:hypothetical protein
MSTKPFEYGDVRVMLVNPSNETLMDMARYQVRLTVGQERATPASMAGVVEFAAIMAHVRDVENFPCEVPDPKASSEEVMAAWDCFLDTDPGLWDELLRALEIPDTVQSSIAATYLTWALSEYEDDLKRGNLKLPGEWED